MSARPILHLLVGDDDLPLQSAARALVNSLVPETEQAFALEVIAGKVDGVEPIAVALKSCSSALRTPALLLATAKVVWLRDASFLSGGTSMRDQGVRERMDDLVDALRGCSPESVCLVVTCSDIDRKSALFRFASERGVIREFLVPDKNYLQTKHFVERARSEFAERGLRAREEVIEAFCGRVGPDSRTIAMEAEKLSLFMGERREVSVQDIPEIVSRTAVTAVWDFLDAVGSRSFPSAVVALRELLANGESPIGIVAALASRLRDLILYREALDKGWVTPPSGYARRGESLWNAVPPEVDSVLGGVLKRDPRTTHPFYAGRLLNQARKYSLAELVRNHRLVVQAHESLVSSHGAPAVVMEVLLTRMIR